MKNYEDLKVEGDLKQLLIGSLLGDGCYCSQGKHVKNMCLSVAHSLKQREYLQFKWEILNKYGLAPKSIRESYVRKERYSHELGECRLKSRVHPIFTKIRNECYDLTGHKRICKNFVADINELGLAIWYMDDGYVTRHSCILSTCSFTLEEQQILADLLLEKFGLHFTIGKNDNSMYLLAKDFPKFVDLIKSYVIPQLQYKLIPYSKRVLHKSGELLEHPIVDNQQPSVGLTTYEGSETNS